MENQKFSIKKVINQGIVSLRGNCAKAFLSSLLQFSIFLIAYILTGSLIISSISWALFLPTQTAFMLNISDNDAQVERVLKIGKNWLTYVVLAVICTFCYVMGFVALIVPAFVFYVNAVFAFEIAKDNSVSAFEALKQSHQIAKGYRKKILAIGLIYFFILILAIVLSTLLVLLVSLFVSMSDVVIVKIGILGGLALYMIFVMPVNLLTISNLKGAIEQDKLLKSLEQNEQDAQDKNNLEENVEVEVAEPVDLDNQKSDTDDDPTNLIV